MVVFTWYKKTLVVLSYLDQVGGVMSLLDAEMQHNLADSHVNKSDEQVGIAG